jgi:hypothetical protein
LFNLENKEYHTERIVNRYIIYMLVCYCTIYKNRKGEDLWQIFHKDFEGFIYNIFKLRYCVTVRELQEQLNI